MNALYKNGRAHFLKVIQIVGRMRIEIHMKGLFLIFCGLLFMSCASPDYYERVNAEMAEYQSSPKAREDRERREKAQGRLPLEFGRATIYLGDKDKERPYPDHQ